MDKENVKTSPSDQKGDKLAPPDKNEVQQVIAAIKKINADPIAQDLFSDIAELAARNCQNSDKNRPAQLRQFYDELVMWADKIGAKKKAERESEFEKNRPYIKMMKAKVHYSRGRKPPKITDEFLDIFLNLIDQINSVEGLQRAKTFMEAFMGYMKFFNTKYDKKKTDND